MVRRRNPRVAEQVRQVLAELIESEVADPRLVFVTITEVDVTPDHDVATVYYSSLDPSLVTRDPRRSGGDRLPTSHEVEEGLAAATPRLRSLLGQRLRLRVTPELRFRPDPVVEQAARIDALLRDLDRDAAPGTAPASADGPDTGSDEHG